jgi:hypothetical protein
MRYARQYLHGIERGSADFAIESDSKETVLVRGDIAEYPLVGNIVSECVRIDVEPLQDEVSVDRHIEGGEIVGIVAKKQVQFVDSGLKRNAIFKIARSLVFE